MLLKELRQQVLEFGCMMHDAKLVRDGQGNISVLDEESGYIVITPTTIPYGKRKIEDIGVVDRNRHLIDGDSPIYFRDCSAYGFLRAAKRYSSRGS